MTSSKFVPAAWQSETRLQGKAQAPRFVRTHWDERAARAFGPWRVINDPDPTDSLSSPAPVISSDSEASEPMTPPPDKSESSKGGETTHEQSSEINSNSSLENRPSNVGVTNNAHESPGLMDEEKIKILRQQGYVQGLKDGMAKALSDLEVERHKERELIRNLVIEIKSIRQDPDKIFNPLKLLSLHLAEQITRSEILKSLEFADNLVQKSVDYLHKEGVPIMVATNPEDFRVIKSAFDNQGIDVVLTHDESLSRGSVVVKSGNTVIEDLIENRIKSIANDLLGEENKWIEKNSILGHARNIFKNRTSESAEDSNFTEIDQKEIKSPKEPQNNEQPLSDENDGNDRN